MKRKLLGMVTIAAMCTMLFSGCAEKHSLPPPPPAPPGAPAPPAK